jgi:hypothetical protein
MTLLKALVNDVSDQDAHKLSSLLLRAKVLARRLKSDGFLQWVTNELDGYPCKAKTPEYRIIYPAVLGDCDGHLGQTSNVPISLNRCPEYIQKEVGEFPLLDNCAAIEAMLASSSETHHRHFPLQAVQVVRPFLGTLRVGQQLVSLQAMFTDTQVAAVLFAIRNRLLDFLLSLEEECPDITGDDMLGDTGAKASIERLVERHLSGGGLVVHAASMEVTMRDSFHVGQAGAVGPGAKASNPVLHQVVNLADVNLESLAKELRDLADHLRKEVKTPEDHETLGTVVAAQMAAEQGDGPKATAYLARILPAVWDTCGKLGIGVAIRAIAQTLGY